MVIVTGEVDAGGAGPDPGPGGGVRVGTGGGVLVPVGLGCGLGPVVGGGGGVDGGGVGDSVGGGVGGGVGDGGVVGGEVGVAAGAGSGMADTADFAAPGQASTMLSETAADAITMSAPTPMRRTFMSPDCPLGSPGQGAVSEAGLARSRPQRLDRRPQSLEQGRYVLS